MSRVAHLLLVSLLAACSFGEHLLPGAGGPDGGGVADASGVDVIIVPGADAADLPDGPVTCEPACLSPEMLRTCTGPDVSCSLGCISDATGPHCGALVPANFVPINLLDGADAQLDVGEGAGLIMNSDDGSIVDCFGAVVREAGTGIRSGVRFEMITPTPTSPAIGMFAFDSLTVSSLGTLRVVGGNAVALLSAGDVEIPGYVVVSGGLTACNEVVACGGIDGRATRQCAGPGGGAGGAANDPGEGPGAGAPGIGDNRSSETGGGGGAFGGTGGQGGLNGGAGGQAFGGPEPLSGGSGGGGGGEDNNQGAGGFGGGGGGGLQITSLTRLRVWPGGGVLSGGGGGGFGQRTQGGAGGGAGGTVVLEAPLVIVEGALSANGGGGGGGGGLDVGGFATPGADGSFGDVPAAGGLGLFVGGAGGSRSSPDGEPGQPTSFAGDGGAGGGGGVGRIAVRTASGGAMIDNGDISPQPRVDPIQVQ